MAKSNLAEGLDLGVEENEEGEETLATVLGKKSRVGGRQRAYNECEALIVAAKDATQNATVADALSDLLEKVQSTRGLKVTGQNVSVKSYVGVEADGTKVMFKFASAPTQESHGAKYTTVFGPYKVVGAAFRTNHAVPTDEIATHRIYGDSLGL